jgi:membrane protein implicated in regulation of membrane protease activity
MLLLIIGLHFILGAIWLMSNNYEMYGIICFILGMAATHYGWKQMQRRKAASNASDSEDDQDEQ